MNPDTKYAPRHAGYNHVKAMALPVPSTKGAAKQPTAAKQTKTFSIKGSSKPGK